jgi:hypothetical protein
LIAITGIADFGEFPHPVPVGTGRLEFAAFSVKKQIYDARG